MNLEKLLMGSVEGLGIYLIYKVACQAINEGTASRDQVQLVNSYSALITENKNSALLRQMRIEADVIEEQKQLIAEQQQRYDEKWGKVITQGK